MIVHRMQRLTQRNTAVVEPTFRSASILITNV